MFSDCLGAWPPRLHTQGLRASFYRTCPFVRTLSLSLSLTLSRHVSTCIDTHFSPCVRPEWLHTGVHLLKRQKYIRANFASVVPAPTQRTFARRSRGGRPLGPLPGPCALRLSPLPARTPASPPTSRCEVHSTYDGSGYAPSAPCSATPHPHPCVPRTAVPV